MYLNSNRPCMHLSIWLVVPPHLFFPLFYSLLPLFSPPLVGKSVTWLVTAVARTGKSWELTQHLHLSDKITFFFDHMITYQSYQVYRCCRYGIDLLCIRLCFQKWPFISCPIFTSDCQWPILSSNPRLKKSWLFWNPYRFGPMWLGLWESVPLTPSSTATQVSDDFQLAIFFFTFSAGGCDLFLNSAVTSEEVFPHFFCRIFRYL